MKIGLLYARSRNGVIGRAGGLPWRLPADMAHFKAVTMGHPCIMGRKTWESIPPKFRPLAGRRNIVITRRPDWQDRGAERAGSLEAAIALCGDVPLVWIVGGADIYRQAEPLAQVADVTEIEQDVEGDAYAPVLGPGWREVRREHHPAADGHPAFSFVTYERA